LVLDLQDACSLLLHFLFLVFVRDVFFGIPPFSTSRTFLLIFIFFSTPVVIATGVFLEALFFCLPPFHA